VLKPVRIWFKKDGAAKYISHLDLNRCMTRAVQRSKLPVWHTEGFNPHPFLTFALPLSLGMRSTRESMDVRFLEEVPAEEIVSRLNAVLPEGIRVYDAAEPVMKPGQIAFAHFDILLSSDVMDTQSLSSALLEFLMQDEIMVEKRSKSGVKDIDLKQGLHEYHIEPGKQGILFQVVLPAGSTNNVNPSLFTDAFEKYVSIELDIDITRTDLLDEKRNSFQ
jgi:radical SAM-linked protein